MKSKLSFFKETEGIREFYGFENILRPTTTKYYQRQLKSVRFIFHNDPIGNFPYLIIILG